YLNQPQTIQPPASGETVFVPQQQPMPMGFNLAIKPVIADDHTVRLELAPTIVNLVEKNVPLFPITNYITPVFDGGAQALPIPFTQFLPQPTLTTLSGEATVDVPDGQTLLVGGWRMRSPCRSELTSKIPWLNSLLECVGLGQDTSTIVMLVTPRVVD